MADDEPPAPASLALPDFAPVPRRCKRHDGWTPARQKRFIEALADYGSVRAAANAVGLAPEGAYQLRRQPGAEQFAGAWEAALACGVKRIEDALMERALHGTEEELYYHGELRAKRRRYNDRLGMFMLRNRAPDRFAAGGGSRGLSALDKMEVKRLEKQWEADRQAKSGSLAQVHASIDRKLEALRKQVKASASPAALELEIAHIAQRRADDEAGWRPDTDYAQYAEKAAALLPKHIAEVRREFFPTPRLAATKESAD